jgi:cellulose synthase/poly-beta-1,6-N-acetylglucosamine synthase-like glycosyltransferase
VIFVVDDPADPAVSVINIISHKHAGSVADGRPPVATKLVVAPKSLHSSQKAENLREAVLHANPYSEAFVFVDSDARPAINWLHSLVTPLEEKTVGATTGYRWFISRTPTLVSELRSMWNASIASALGPNEKSNFCWGGSMAIRRDTFEELGIRYRWHGTVSDDFTVTRAMNESGKKIRFVPQALTPTIEDCTWRQLIEFTNRQMKITRVYAPKLWTISFLGSGLFIAVMTATFLLIIFSGRNGVSVWAAISTLFIVSLFSIGKSIFRLRAVELVLGAYKKQVRQQYFIQSFLWLLAPALFFVNCFSALLSRKIEWRGISYLMISPVKTKVLANKGK